jgi:serine protease Do
MNTNTKRRLWRAGAVVAVIGLSIGGGFLGGRLTSSGSGAADSSVADAIPGLADLSGSIADYRSLTASLNYAGSDDITEAFQDRFRAVAASTLPSVVELNIMNTVIENVPMFNPFGFFNNQSNGSQSLQREYTQRGLGSGVIVSQDGRTVYVLTNNHVAGDADKIEVVLADGRSFEGTLVGSDSLIDLAVVSFQTNENVPVADLGDSDRLAVGDWVFAMGNPLGFQSTVTAGIVSALGRDVSASSAVSNGMSGITDYIQTDAAISQGNSGGALVNINGEVIGINTWIASQTGGNEGLGFAIPINNAKRAVDDLINHGEVYYSWLGVQAGSVSESLGDDLGLSGDQGAFVYNVYGDSPAEAAGLHPGDFIISVNDNVIANSADLVQEISAINPGDRATITVIRDGEQRDLTVRTARRNQESEALVETLWPGVSVTPLTDDIREQLGTANSTHGVVVSSVASGGRAEAAGIQTGDIIEAVNGNRIRNAVEFYDQLNNERRGEIRFQIQRGGKDLIMGFVDPTA